MPDRATPSRKPAPAKSSSTERARATQLLILTAAERLFVEHGIFPVSNRQIADAAGQANSAAVWYHFGTKTDLVRAIVSGHSERIERRRVEMVDQLNETASLRDWVACLVRPLAEHLDELGSPTWHARFIAQVIAEPSLRSVMHEAALSPETQSTIIAGLNRFRANLPPEVVAERNDMARLLIVHICAERERALAEGTGTLRPSWSATAAGLIDAITGLWLAPADGSAR